MCYKNWNGKRSEMEIFPPFREIWSRALRDESASITWAGVLTTRARKDLNRRGNVRARAKIGRLARATAELYSNADPHASPVLSRQFALQEFFGVKFLVIVRCSVLWLCSNAFPYTLHHQVLLRAILAPSPTRDGGFARLRISLRREIILTRIATQSRAAQSSDAFHIIAWLCFWLFVRVYFFPEAFCDT